MGSQRHRDWLELGGNPELVAAGTTRDELVRKAAELAAGPAFREPTILVATQDRGEAAAMLLAAAVSPLAPVLVVPYALSPRVLDEVNRSTVSGLDLGTGAGPALLEARSGSDEPPPGGSPTAMSPVLRISRAAPVRRSDFLHLYTGGTTGQPKVWAKSRDNLFGEARLLAQRFGIGPSDTILAAVPPYHIYGMLFSVLLPLVSGARVIAETPFLPREIEGLAEQHGASVLVAAPAHYRALAAGGVGIPGLRMAFSSGGFLDEGDGLRFGELSHTRVVEVYGSTETGGIASRCRQDGEADWEPFPVIEWGVDGERLCVRSPFLSPGLELRKDGMFITGDRVERVPGGRFRLLGRADGVVKVGGKRVDLEDVRRRLLALHGVRDALVLGLPLPGGRETEVVALVVGDGDEPAWRHAASGVLEPAQRPRRFVQVESLPLTAAGKPDMEAARRLAADRS
jgi:acyl-coenzyme A synthetase/AMP-(fatty) acid ligase